MRKARIKGRGITLEMVDNYLPANYRTVLYCEPAKLAGLEEADLTPYVLIEGTDQAGWTLDDYVLPRLASGGLFGEEVPA